MLKRKSNADASFGLMTGNLLKFVNSFLGLPVLSPGCTNDNTGNRYFRVLQKF
jgi:hypothetical protein